MDREVRDVVTRRAEFLIAEVRSGEARYDHAVRFTLRSLSNYLHVGGDYGSLGVSRRMRYRSRCAHDLLFRQTGTKTQRYGAWGRLIRNEHPEPLNVVWSRFKAMPPDALTPAEIFRQLAEWPMVVVTIDEDTALRNAHAPFDRYRTAGVEVLTGDPASEAGWVASPQFAYDK